MDFGGTYFDDWQRLGVKYGMVSLYCLSWTDASSGIHCDPLGHPDDSVAPNQLIIRLKNFEMEALSEAQASKLLNQKQVTIVTISEELI